MLMPMARVMRLTGPSPGTPTILSRYRMAVSPERKSKSSDGSSPLTKRSIACRARGVPIMETGFRCTPYWSLMEVME